MVQLLQNSLAVPQNRKQGGREKNEPNIVCTYKLKKQKTQI
jgi:hypothetical protein